MRVLTSILVLLIAVMPVLAGDKADKRKAERERKERADVLEKARKDRKKRAKSNRKTNEALGEKLAEVLQGHADKGFSGTVLVMKDGEKILEAAHGFADVASERKNEADTIYDIGSLAKQFTAAAILRLEDQGKLSSDDKLQKFWDDLPEDKRGLTLLQLMNHTSGMSRMYKFDGVDLSDRDTVVRHLLKAPLTHKPGEVHEYSNAGYFILAAVIDKTAKQGFDDYMRDEIFKVAELNDTALGGDSKIESKRVAGRYDKGKTGGLAHEYGMGWTSRGATRIMTTVDEMWKWTLALEEEEVLSHDAKQNLFEPAKGDYACGWRILESPTGTKKIHHSGASYGMLSWYAWYPDDDVVIVLFTNDATVDGIHFTVSRDLETAVFAK